MTVRETILQGRAALGIELGSTRIKAVLIDESRAPIASGSFGWENRLENGVWTYSLDDVRAGLQSCYRALLDDVRARYDIVPETFSAIGVSAMMHGYLVFDDSGRQLAPFRTWRNTMTAVAAAELTQAFHFNIPQRWSVAHLRQAMLSGEAHVPQIRFMTTLSGYVHWLLTGEKVVGLGEASGMFPVDPATGAFDAAMLDTFDRLAAPLHLPWTLRDVLPGVLPAGARAGRLTEDGARLLDPTGTLRPGIPLCPPEGDAGTGMVATNSVAPRTGNVSAGTSVFAMVVMEKALERVHPEIDVVATPSGRPVAMVHCNNCTSDLNAWVGLFGEFASSIGAQLTQNELFGTLLRSGLDADADCGGLLACNYLSGEHITGLDEGRPLFARTPDARFTLGNFMRAHLYASLATLKLGMDILTGEERVCVDRMFAHGGLFKTPVVGQKFLAAAIDAPVSVLSTAGEGGAWGVALLADFMARGAGVTLENYLADEVFRDAAGEELRPDAEDVAGFRAYIDRFTAALPVERAAADTLR